MSHEVDRNIAAAEQQLRSILTGIPLTATEQQYVNAASKRVVRTVYESLQEIPEEKRWEMRGIVLAVAIAMIIAPGKNAAKGVNMFEPGQGK